MNLLGRIECNDNNRYFFHTEFGTACNCHSDLGGPFRDPKQHIVRNHLSHQSATTSAYSSGLHH